MMEQNNSMNGLGNRPPERFVARVKRVAKEYEIDRPWDAIVGPFGGWIFFKDDEDRCIGNGSLHIPSDSSYVEIREAFERGWGLTRKK